MGCIPNQKKINISYERSLLSAPFNCLKEVKSAYKRKISQANWLKVVDFLLYTEVKEIGKINKELNQVAKQDIILIKFFKNKLYDKRSITKSNNNKSPLIVKRELSKSYLPSFYGICTIVHKSLNESQITFS